MIQKSFFHDLTSTGKRIVEKMVYTLYNHPKGYRAKKKHEFTFLGVKMSNLNYVFLEEFKYLDKFCQEIYGTEKGVTSYIDDMKNVPEYERRAIPNWDSDLKRLIHLRHLRNQLCHELGTLNKDMCTQSDIDWLKQFYNRFFDESDPMTLLNQIRNGKIQQMKTNPNPQESTYIYKMEETSKRPSGCLATFAIFIVSFAVILVLIIIAYMLALKWMSF